MLLAVPNVWYNQLKVFNVGSKMSKEEIILQLVDIFRRQGYEGASLSEISKLTGLGKASLYHHFPGGKEEMAASALTYIDSCLERLLLKPLNSEASPSEKLQQMFDRVQTFFDGGRKSCLWAVLLLGESSDDRFHNRIKQALSRWIEAIATVLQEAGLEAELAQVRAEEAVLRIQGALILSRGLNNTAPFQRTIDALKNELCRSE